MASYGENLRKDLEASAKKAAATASGRTRRIMDAVNERLGVVPDKGELHTKPDIGHIAAIGMRHPEQLTMEQIKSLCGEVDRHIRSMKNKK